MENFLKLLAKKIEVLRAFIKIPKNKEIPVSSENLPSKEFPKETQTVRLEIPAPTIVKVILIIFLFWALKEVIIQLQSFLTIVAVSFFLAIGLSPFVDRLEKLRFPRPIAIFLLYTIFLGVLGILFVKIIPIIAKELIDMSHELKNFLISEKFENTPFIKPFLEYTGFESKKLESILSQDLALIAHNLQGIAQSTLSIFVGIFRGLFNFIFALVLLFFILMEREKIGNFSLLFFPESRRNYVQQKFLRIQTKMASWFHGQFILMICVGFFMYAGMKIFEVFFGMKYALTIGLLSGIMELFPYIGIFFTGFLCVLIAINISWILVVAVLIWMAITQFLEGNLLVPMVMGKTVGLSSVVVMLAVAIGGILGSAFGGVPLAIIGMIFSVPVVASIAIFVEEYVYRDK